MYSDSSSKSEILNKPFKSVFTKKSTTTTPRLFGNKYPSIGNLSITLKGVQKFLEKINISKAAGPDLIPGRMLNMLAPELAPIVHAIFTQSLRLAPMWQQSGTLLFCSCHGIAGFLVDELQI